MSWTITLPRDNTVVFYASTTNHVRDTLTLEPSVTRSNLRTFRIENPGRHVEVTAPSTADLIRFDFSLGAAIQEAARLHRTFAEQRMQCEIVLAALSIEAVLDAASRVGTEPVMWPCGMPGLISLYIPRTPTLTVAAHTEVNITEIRFLSDEGVTEDPDYEYIQLFIDSVLQDEGERDHLITHTMEDFLDHTTWRQKYLEQAPEFLRDGEDEEDADLL